MRGPGREVFYGSEISGHSRILRGSRCKAPILASSPWGADAAAPLIGASARGGMGGGGARVLRNRIRSLHTPKIGGGHPTFDMWPLCKVRVSCARFGNYQEIVTDVRLFLLFSPSSGELTRDYCVPSYRKKRGLSSENPQYFVKKG